ncbi:peptidoglycan amidohydrolase family protein [Liquorilactobacillus nagelii]|uniref:peptidoglycan amidohydrolase family protein n=1 Tax=Liquorilactobacillus nagelii TaxID=82688 RepID=UPI0039E9770C
MLYGQQYLSGYWYCFDVTTGQMITGFYYIPNQYKTVYYNNNGQMQYGSRNIDGVNYYFNAGTGALRISNSLQEKVINWYNQHYGKLTYSMYGSRNGNDGTADCSGAMTEALWTSGASHPASSALRWGGYNTVSIRPYLIANGFKLIASNSRSVYVHRGDIVVLGDAVGGAGHVGIISNGGNLTDSYSQTRLLSVSGHNRDSKGNHAKNYAVSDLQFESECSGMTFYVYRKA